MDQTQLDRVRASERFRVVLVRDLEPLVRTLARDGVSVDDMAALLDEFWSFAAHDVTRRLYGDDDTDEPPA